MSSNKLLKRTLYDNSCCLFLGRDVEGGSASVSHFVAQLRAVFRPRHANSSPDDCYAYVQPFKPAPGTICRQRGAGGLRAHVTDDAIEMFRVVRCLDGNGNRRGMIVKLTDIWRLVELVPRFKAKCPSRWDSETAVELAEQFFVNSFADKEIYQAVY